MAERPQLEGLSLAEKRMLLAQLLQDKAKQDAVFPLTHGQYGLWVLSQMDAGSAACNIHFPSRIRSRLDVPALHRALQALVDRHASLRTTFESRDGQLVQRVHEEMPVWFELIDAAAWSDGALRQRLETEVHRPFDLQHGPLLRTYLLRRGEDDHIFLATAHHIVMDFWSVIVLLKEIGELYPAECAGGGPPAAAKSLEYAEFVRWQSGLLAGEDGRRLASFWQRCLQGAPHVLDLPTDLPRPPRFSYRAGNVACAVPADVTRQLSELAAHEQTTLYTVLLAALQVLLGRHSGQQDFIIGSPFSGRTRPGFEETVGCFINMLPMRADLSGDPTFRELLVKVRDRVFDALQNQDYPFPRIVEQLDVTHDPSRPPLVQAALTLEQSPWQREAGRAGFLFPGARANHDVGGLKGESYYVEQRTCQLELEWVLEQSGDALHGVLRYCADLFQEDSMRRMVQRFQTLLASAADRPDAPISELAWFSEAERQSVIHEWNQTKVEFPRDVCLHHLFERQARELPHATAVRSAGRCVTYAELDAWSNRLAQRLCRLGIGPNGLVALCLERSPEAVAAMLATLKAGGAFVPLDAAGPTERLHTMLKDANPSVLLTQSRFRSRVPSGAWEALYLDEGDYESTEGTHDVPAASGVQPEDLAYVIYTSGSAGKPKGVMVEHRAICNTVLWRGGAFPLQPQDRVLWVVPCVFDASLCVVFPALASGAELVLPEAGEELNSALLVDRIARERVSILTIPPRLLDVLLGEPGIQDCRDVRRVLTGGEVMPSELPSRVRDVFGVPLHNLYGPTEAAVEAACWTSRGDDVRGHQRIGRPIANSQAYVLDAKGKPQPIGVPGELYLGGAGLARGYLNEGERTRERFLPDPFNEVPGGRMYRTGDRCRWLADGSLEFLGRIDRQVKLRGHRIELGEVEHALASLETVCEAAVAVHPDRAGEPQLVAYVVPAGSQVPLDRAGLRRGLQSRLPAYMVPAIIEQRPSLPRTPTGKLDRRALPPPRWEQALDERPYRPPRTPLETFLVDLWREMLSVDRLGVEDRFYELGGSSIQGAMLVSRLQERLGHRVRLAALFEMPNVAALALHLAENYPDAVAEQFGIESLPRAMRAASKGNDTRDKRAAANGAVTGRPHPLDVLVPLQSEGEWPPLFMVHPPGGIVLCYQPLAHHIGRDWPLYGVRARGLHGGEVMPERLEEMAAEYVNAIRTVQPRGPYLLGGWSLGGVVAYEMAQQLLKQGERVGMLALLDTTIPHGEANREYNSDAASSGVEYGLDLSLEDLAALDPDEQLPYLWNHAQKLGVLDDDAPAEVLQQVLDDLKRIFHTHVKLATEYSLRRYRGPITLFRPQDAPVAVPTPTDRGWGRLADDVEVHFVPGQHHTMVKPPHVEVLAGRLRECMEAALTSKGATMRPGGPGV